MMLDNITNLYTYLKKKNIITLAISFNITQLISNLLCWIIYSNWIFQNDVTSKVSGANSSDHEVVLGVDTTVTLRDLESGSGVPKIASSKNPKQSAKFIQLVEEMVRKNTTEVLFSRNFNHFQ